MWIVEKGQASQSARLEPFRGPGKKIASEILLFRYGNDLGFLKEVLPMGIPKHQSQHVHSVTMISVQRLSKRRFAGLCVAKRKGAAVVEFAIVLPVFVAILLGTIEACSMVFLRQSVEMAAYEAARVAIVNQTKADQVQQAAKVVLDSRKVRDYTVKITPTNFQAAPYGSFIQIEVSAPCSSNSLIPVMYYGGRNVIGQVEMMKEY
jgi:hypothetical protein